MAFAFRSQPFKGIYLTACFIFFFFLQLPLYTFLYASPKARPRRSWTLRRSLIVMIYRRFINVTYNTTLMAPPSLEQIAAERVAAGFVWVEAAPKSLTTGEIWAVARINGVSAVKTSGFWYPPKGLGGVFDQKASKDEKVIYHFHGGGFVMGSAHPSKGTLRSLVDGLQKHLVASLRVFALEYRLSSAPPFQRSNPFPAALLDAVSGYHYLVKHLGFEPKNIIISGDSAGGLVAFWLARYLAICKFPGLSNPGGLLLISPAADWAATHMGPGSSMKQNSSSDYMGTILAGTYTCRALLGNLPEAETSKDPWISPGSAFLEHTAGMFAGLPKTCIIAGGAEQSLDAIITLKGRLSLDLGENNVKYFESPDATHDFLIQSWHEPERTEALIYLAQWVKEDIW